MSKRAFAFFAGACVAVVFAASCHFHLLTIQIPKGSAAATLLSLPVSTEPVRVEVVNSNGTPVNDNQTPDEILDEIINRHGGTP